MAHQIHIRGRARRKIRVGKDISGFGGISGTAAGQQGTIAFTDFYTSTMIDIDDKVADRFLNQKYGDFWSVPHFEFNLNQYGTAATGSAGLGLILRAPKDLVVRDVNITTGVSPGAGGTIVVDIKQVPTPTAAGTSIFVAASAQPKIIPGSVSNFVSGTASIFSTAIAGGSANGGSSFFWGSGVFLRAEIQGVGVSPTGKNIGIRIGASLPWVDTNQAWEVGEGAFVDSQPPPTSNPFFTR